ncbi:MAG: transglycosylase domain-containing protein [Spirochaetaceae bacterium]|nr:transglycosylase domain-containing protein [Spirochaetaceae bacterium]
MFPARPGRTPYRRRPDTLPGSASLEARLAAAIRARLLEAEGGTAFAPPPELRLAPPPSKGKRGFRLRARGLLRGLALGLLLAHASYIFATSFLIGIYRFTDPSATVLMAYRKWGFGWKIERPRPLRLKAVPSYARRMLVSVEDGKFYEHFGLDFEAFERAREINARLKRPLYGGSTLTMQVARTLFLVPEKSYVRKYLEVIAALELELLLPKDRILELYFGYAEWGKGVFGIEAAARHHYGRSLSRLSREETARLVALLSSPIKYRPATLERSGILRERYQYLQRRYLEQ